MNFEEYLKKPFEEPEFEFKEAYWQSAEKLIDNHYQRVRWIRAGIIGGIMVATFFAFYFFFKTKEASTPVPALTQEQHLNPNNNSLENTQSNIQPSKSEDNLSLLYSDSETSGPISSEANTLKSKEKSPSESKSTASIDNNSNKAIPSTKNKVSKTSQNRSRESVNASLKSADSNSKAIIYTHNNSSQSEVSMNVSDLKINKTFEGQKSSTLENKDQKEIQIQATAPDTESIKPEYTSTSILTESHSISALDLPFRNIKISNSLKLLDFPLHLDFGNNRPIIAIKKPSRMYATAEMLMYPSGNTEAFKFLGFSAGLGYQKPLSKMTFLDIGVSGSFRRGNFAPSVVSTQLNYDFGPRSDAYILRPQALYSLQIPVLFGIELGRHMISAGVKLGFLIGVRGTSEYANYTHPFESPTSKESYSYNVVEEGWIESSGFRKFALAYALKYRYRLNSRFMIGASLQYLPSDWIANDFGKYYNFTSNEYQNPIGNPAHLIERNWLLGVELKYVLFSKF